MLLLEFDCVVDRFEEQPVNIPLPGIPQGYTPDLLVHFYQNLNNGECQPPALIEVKHTSDLAKHATKYSTKFDAARAYASARGWEFAIKTELDIRTQRLANLKFLRAYCDLEPATADCATIKQLVVGAGGHLEKPPTHGIIAVVPN